MALTISSDDPFKSLNRLNTVPIITVENTHRPIPIKDFFSFSPWTVEKEECFYNEKIAQILETGHIVYRLLQIAFTISFISIPILFRSTINLHWRKATLAFEFLVISFLAISKLGTSIQFSENITTHLDSIKNELATLRKQGLEILASETPTASAIDQLKEVQTNFDSRKGMMIQSFSSRANLKEDPSLSSLSQFALNLHDDFTTMQSIVVSLFNQEDQGEEEKEIVSVLKQLCIEDGDALKQKIPDLFNKIQQKLKEKLRTTFKGELPLEPLQKETLHLMNNLNNIDQFINLLKKTFEVEDENLPVFYDLYQLTANVCNYLTTMQSLVVALFNQEGQGEEEKEIVSVLKQLCKEDDNTFVNPSVKKISDLLKKIEKKIERKFQNTIKHGLPFETLKEEILHLIQNLNNIDQLISLLLSNFEANLAPLHIFSSLQNKLQRYTSVDPNNNIPDDILNFSQKLQSICEDKTLSFELESWLMSKDNFSALMPISKTEKIKTLSIYCLQNPEEMLATSFWEQELPGLFIGLNLYLEKKPDHHLTKEAELLLGKFKKLEVTPDSFCTHALDLLTTIDLFSEQELWEFGYYYRIFILREKYGFYLDKYSGLA